MWNVLKQIYQYFLFIYLFIYLFIGCPFLSLQWLLVWVSPAGASQLTPYDIVVARCRFMGSPAHGFYEKGKMKRGDMIKHGVQITYGCFRGYTLVGANMQECSYGKWTNNRPSCQGKLSHVPAQTRHLHTVDRTVQRLTNDRAM